LADGNYTAGQSSRIASRKLGADIGRTPRRGTGGDRVDGFFVCWRSDGDGDVDKRDATDSVAVGTSRHSRRLPPGTSTSRGRRRGRQRQRARSTAGSEGIELLGNAVLFLARSEARGGGGGGGGAGGEGGPGGGGVGEAGVGGGGEYGWAGALGAPHTRHRHRPAQMVMLICGSPLLLTRQPAGRSGELAHLPCGPHPRMWYSADLSLSRGRTGHRSPAAAAGEGR